MGNKGIKILILFAVSSLAILCVLAFYHTIVAPPSDVPVYNLHKMDLDSDIHSFKSEETMDYNDSIYSKVICKLDLYEREGFITLEEKDSFTIGFVNEYLPIFKGLCYSKFQASEWKDSDHDAMLNRISHLRNLSVDDGETNVVAANKNHGVLTEIEIVIKNYRVAKRVSKHQNFYSVEDAKEKIEKAKYYAGLYPLSYCTDLVENLSEVNLRIGKSHYNKLEAGVQGMGRYRNMNMEAFDALSNRFENQLKEYEAIKYIYGEDAKNTRELKYKAYVYCEEAENHYKKIVIDKGGWDYIETPVQSYKALQSVSNFHVSNSEAVMSFEIKGYEKFTFYIRSNGEEEQDYVMVGLLDRKPYRDVYHKSTKGNSKGCNSLSCYEEVTFDRLNKYKAYKIYVVYVKDHADNFGTDRGYVLIPEKKK